MEDDAPMTYQEAAGAGQAPTPPAEWAFLGLAPETQSKLLVSVALVAGLVLGRRLLLRIVERRLEDRTAVYRWGKVSGYAAFVIGLVVVLQVWFTAMRSLGTFLGLLSAGLAIALKDPIANLAGWIFILWRKPFQLGDRVEVAGRAGDVVDVRLFAFTLMEIGEWVAADQSTGRLVHVPNAKVFLEPVANYTASFPFLWNELSVRLTFESDWRKAKRILEEVVTTGTESVSQEAEHSLKATSRRFLIHFTKLTPMVYTSVEEDGVILTIRYLCHPRRRRGTAHELWEAVLDAFEEHEDIAFGYRTQRLFLNPLEGKQDARAPLAGAWVRGGLGSDAPPRSDPHRR